MSPDIDRIRPEQDKKGVIRVHRTRFEGANRFGRPFGLDLGSKSFGELGEASQWICEGSNQFTHSLELPFDTKVSAEVIGSPGEKQKVAINVSGRKNIIPRNVDGQHGVSTDRETFIKLTFHIGERSDPFLDRGLAWLDVTDPEQPRLGMSLLANSYTPDLVRQKIYEVKRHVMSTLDKMVSHQ